MYASASSINPSHKLEHGWGAGMHQAAELGEAAHTSYKGGLLAAML